MSYILQSRTTQPIDTNRLNLTTTVGKSIVYASSNLIIPDRGGAVLGTTTIRTKGLVGRNFSGATDNFATPSFSLGAGTTYIITSIANGAGAGGSAGND